MYRVGEYVAVQDHQSEGTEWIVQITALLVYGPVNNAYAHFFNGKLLCNKITLPAITETALSEGQH